MYNVQSGTPCSVRHTCYMRCHAHTVLLLNSPALRRIKSQCAAGVLKGVLFLSFFQNNPGIRMHLLRSKFALLARHYPRPAQGKLFSLLRLHWTASTTHHKLFSLLHFHWAASSAQTGPKAKSHETTKLEYRSLQSGRFAAFDPTTFGKSFAACRARSFDDC